MVRICPSCTRPIAPADRRDLDAAGRWVHATCPPVETTLTELADQEEVVACYRCHRRVPMSQAEAWAFDYVCHRCVEDAPTEPTDVGGEG